MTVEFKDGIPSADECSLNEHSRMSRAKKTIEVGPYLPTHATKPENEAPITAPLVATAVELALKSKSAYRLIGSSALHFRMSMGAVGSAVTAVDIYLPANTPMVVRTDDRWDRVTVVKSTGTTDGLVQVMRVQ